MHIPLGSSYSTAQFKSLEKLKAVCPVADALLDQLIAAGSGLAAQESIVLRAGLIAG
ncbi:MAG TPA: hypothetical protein VIM41_14380 [Gammaproteobacteria bacterium]